MKVTTGPEGYYYGTKGKFRIRKLEDLDAGNDYYYLVSVKEDNKDGEQVTGFWDDDDSLFIQRFGELIRRWLGMTYHDCY